MTTTILVVRERPYLSWKSRTPRLLIVAGMEKLQESEPVFEGLSRCDTLKIFEHVEYTVACIWKSDSLVLDQDGTQSLSCGAFQSA
jgi:hypothetical protein